MVEELTVHSHFLLATMVLHLAVIFQRIIVIGAMEHLPEIAVINVGVGLVGVGGIIAIFTFILFMVKKIRKRVPKLVFICILVFNVMVDACGAGCLGIFMNLTKDNNALIFVSGYLITIGVILILEGVTILLFAVIKASGVKSHRPVDESNKEDGNG